MKPWSAINYAWARGAAAAGTLGLALHFYYMREMLVSLAVFSVLFFLLGLVALSVFSIVTLFRREREGKLRQMPIDGWGLDDARGEIRAETGSSPDASKQPERILETNDAR